MLINCLLCLPFFFICMFLDLWVDLLSFYHFMSKLVVFEFEQANWQWCCLFIVKSKWVKCQLVNDNKLKIQRWSPAGFCALHQILLSTTNDRTYWVAITIGESADYSPECEFGLKGDLNYFSTNFWYFAVFILKTVEPFWVLLDFPDRILDRRIRFRIQVQAYFHYGLNYWLQIEYRVELWLDLTLNYSHSPVIKWIIKKYWIDSIINYWFPKENR